MRDPNRIDEFCEILRQEWHKAPDWRFTQLIANIFGDYVPFYLEDDEAQDILQTKMKSFFQPRGE